MSTAGQKAAKSTKGQRTSFQWDDPLLFDDQLTEDERLIRDTVRQYVREKFLPVFNRCVVFSTTEDSYHGHPHPLTCPPDRTRKSLALYYYTNGRPEEERSTPHDTIFKKTHEHDW